MRETSLSIKKNGTLLRRRGALPPGQRFSHSARAWMVWIVSLAFVLFQFFLQLSFGEMVGAVMSSYKLSATEGSVLASSYYFIYVLLQMPAGMLIDRYGPRRILSTGALVVVVGCLMFAEAPSFLVAMLGRLLMGTGAAFAFVGSLNLVSMWFPANRFGVMAALAETTGMFGSIVGTILLAMFVHQVGWRDCMVFSAGLSLVLAVLLWWVVRDTPDNVTLITQRSFSAWWVDVKLLFKNKIAWLNGAYTGLLFLMITVFVALWSVPFLQLAYHMSLVKATLVSDIVFIGAAIGNPLIGWLDARINNRRYILVTFPLISAVLLAILMFSPSLPMFEVVLLMFAFGLLVSSYILPYVIGNELAPRGARTTSLGFVNTLSVGSAPIVGPLIGWVLDHPIAFGSHHAVMAGSMAAYQQSFTIFLVCLLLGSVMGYYLPKRPVVTDEEESLIEDEDSNEEALDMLDRII
ncbi:MAG: MFS transporter [Coxiellaceae bacterium]|nr:MFS transporter [Coxiellaceae bacterium]|tara:strand:+ start:1629 stop:3020 length:1392 start_codon:yes stop_codon:yes gene_type:complete